MKGGLRLAILIGWACLMARPSEAVIAIQNTVAARSTFGAELSAAGGMTTDGTTTLLTAVCGVYFGGGATFATVTDLLGNTWHNDTGVNGLGFGVRISYAYDHGGSPLSTGVETYATTNNGATSYPACVFRSWTGTDITSAVFVSPGTRQNNSSSPTVAPGAITPASGNLLLTGHVQNSDTNTTVTSPFSAVTQIGPVGSNSVYIGDAYWVATSATSTNPTWTDATTGEQNGAMVQILAGTGGGATIPHGLTTHGIGN